MASTGGAEVASHMLHKLRNVDLKVCSLEQMMAYNIAFGLHLTYQQEYDNVLRNGTCVAVSEGLSKMIQKSLADFQRDHSNRRINIDAVFCALNAGLKKYFEAKTHVFTRYEQVGEMFSLRDDE